MSAGFLEAGVADILCIFDEKSPFICMGEEVKATEELGGLSAEHGPDDELDLAPLALQ